ncbi:DUF349 domain-containing protein [Reinekea sp.]|uniref:DUF349 domain-containing protein n=1 Tax=Reinekea sp. TaxID=1970455 RepID=UPI0039899407
MFQKLFGRKKTVAKTKAPEKVIKPAAKVVLTSPAGLAEDISTAEGKKKQNLLVQLSKLIEADNSILNDVSAALPENERTMLELQFSDVEAQSIASNILQSIATEGYSASVRQLAAAHLSEESALIAVAQAAKTKDKTVYRIVKNKLDTLHEGEKAQQALLDKQQAVIAALAQLAKASHDPMLEAKHRGLLDQWSHCAVSSTDTVKAQFEAANQQVVARIELEKAELQPTPSPAAVNPVAVEKVSQQEAELQSDNQEADSGQVKIENQGVISEQRQILIDTLIKDLVGAIETGVMSEELIQQNQHFLTGIQHQWRESEQVSPTTKAEAVAFHKACTAYEVGLAKLHALHTVYGDYDAIVAAMTKGTNNALLHELEHWLHDVEQVIGDNTPAPIAKIKQALKAHEATLAKHRQQEIDQVRAIRGQIRRCQSAIDEGSIRRASGLYQGVEEKLVGFNFDKHAGLKKMLDDTTEALEKLRDWQSYAVLPKKEALIKKMDALVHQSVTPDERAQSIRDMQEEWKLLSRGLQNRQQDLWETFHELAQLAYEPCKEFYSEQRHLREVNLSKRKEVVEQLTQYSTMIDWTAPDIKEIDRILQAARNDWRNYSPVDRAASKGIQKQFDTLHQSLFNQLAKEQAVFKEQKQQIIERAKALLELEDVKKATTEAKKLQQDWKSAGIVARKDEQRLWKEFREVCDALFTKRDVQTESFKADLETNRVQANEVIAGLEALENSIEPESDQSVYENLKAQYEQIGTLPKEHYPALTKRFKAACDVFTAAARAAKRANADAHWQAVIQWVKRARFESLSEEELNEQWQAIKVPSAAKALFDQHEQWQQPVDELNQAAMHEKTLDFEILVGVESPEEDASMRMNLQVQKLSDGIGYQLTDAQMHRSVVDWLSIGSVEKATYEQFESRLLVARNQYLAKNLK